MTFCVTSVGSGKGADLGGLEGADRHCQTLAQGAGAGGKTWRAYLSTQAKNGQPAISARDRIGQGPWYNAKGDMIAHDLADLHGDTIELARLGSNLNKMTALTEKGEIVPGLSENPKCPGPGCNEHEMLTGSQPDGRGLFEIVWWQIQDHQLLRGARRRTQNNSSTTQVSQKEQIGIRPPKLESMKKLVLKPPSGLRSRAGERPYARFS